MGNCNGSPVQQVVVPVRVHTFAVSDYYTVSHNKITSGRPSICCNVDTDKTIIHSIPAPDRTIRSSKAIEDNYSRTVGRSHDAKNAGKTRNRQLNKTTSVSSNESRCMRTRLQPVITTVVQQQPVIVEQLSYLLYNNNILMDRNEYRFETLTSNSPDYHYVQNAFGTSSNRCKLHSIKKVHNPYIKVQFGLKKTEYNLRGIRYTDYLLFHGTKDINIDSICRKNFDWRLAGTAYGSKFGQGVCFSSKASFSVHYCDDGYYKVMILANVLIGSCCKGNENMPVPPLGFDTTTDGKNTVFVKYEDNTFYPTYVIYFGKN